MLRKMLTGKKLMILALLTLAVMVPVSAALPATSGIPNGWCHNPKNPHFNFFLCRPCGRICGFSAYFIYREP